MDKWYARLRPPVDEMSEIPHRLRIFLCHSSGDKQAVRDLYQRLRADGFEPWLDEENLLPGQDWHRVIPQAVSEADVVLICLSRGSVNKRGYVQKEIKHALDVADEQPENTIYLIPLKLEECEIPERLGRLHWVSFFEATGYERLLNALKHRAGAISVNSGADGFQSPQSGESTEPVSAGASTQTARALKHKPVWGKPAATQHQDIQREGDRRKRNRKGSGAISTVRSSDNGRSTRRSSAERASAEAYFKRGEACREKLAYKGAIVNYSKAIESNPQYTEAFYRRGSIYSDTDRVDLAIEDFSRAIELNPQYAEAYYNRGLSYDYKGKYEEAVKDYTSAIELNPRFAAAYNNRGIIYSARGDYQRAIEDFSEAIKANPQYAVAYYNRGNAYDDTGNDDHAIEDFSKAIELNSQYSQAYFNLGLVHYRKGKYERAVEAFNKAIELEPQDADIYNARGFAYQRLGRTAQAMADRRTYNELSAKQ